MVNLSRSQNGMCLNRLICRLMTLPVLALAIIVSSCDLLDDLMGVEPASDVVANSLDNPANAELLVRSAAAEFKFALDDYIGAAAFMGMEFLGTGKNSGSGDYLLYDKRAVGPSGFAAVYVNDVYEPLSTARFMADNALAHLDQWTEEQVPNRVALIAKAAAYAGYSYTLLGEGMCAAAFDRGPALQPQEIFAIAEERFTRAINAAQAAGSDRILHMARVGRARVRLNLGRAADAAADARMVPEGFSFNLQYSNVYGSTENEIYSLVREGLSASVGVMYRNMNFQGVPDPRVQLTFVGVEGTASGRDIELWKPDKYPGESSPIELATWEEAQLIIAEAAVKSNDPATAVGIINELHANVGLPDFSSSDPDEVMQQIIYERRAELFLESQHLQDIERYGLPLFPAPGEPFLFGGVYGNQICFPLPVVESANNPNV